MKAVLYLLASPTFIFQQPLLVSSVKKKVVVPSESTQLFIRGMGYESRLATAFSLQRSMQKLRVPPFLGTIEVDTGHSACAGSTRFIASISIDLSLIKLSSFRACPVDAAEGTGATPD